MVTPHSLALPPVIAGTDTVAIVPDLLSDLFRGAGLLVLPLPYQGATTVVRLIWHHRMSADPGHAWFRTLLAQLARHAEIGTPSRFKPAVHHARNRRPVTLEIGT